MEKKIFRTSNIDFVAYLKTKGIDFINTEISKNNHKVMFGYDYDFDSLIDLQSQFNSKEIVINMQKYREARVNLLDIVKLYK